MPIDHTAVYVQSDSYQDALKIYTKALKPLGYEIAMQFGPEMTGGFTVTGFAAETGIPNYKPADFWVTEVKETPNAPCHMAFKSKDRPSVDAFYEAAIKAGAKDNGAPGIRSHYHANYYAAFFIDPAGNNIEAVCHSAE